MRLALNLCGNITTISTIGTVFSEELVHSNSKIGMHYPHVCPRVSETVSSSVAESVECLFFIMLCTCVDAYDLSMGASQSAVLLLQEAASRFMHYERHFQVLNEWLSCKFSSQHRVEQVLSCSQQLLFRFDLCHIP